MKKIAVVFFAVLAFTLTSCRTAPGTVSSAEETVSAEVSDVSETAPAVATQLTENTQTSSETQTTAANTTGGAFILSSVKMITATAGWASNGKNVCRTTDGGSSWADVTPKYTSQPFDTVAYFLNTNTAWAVSSFEDGSAITASRTDNGGKSWKLFQIPMDNPTTLYHTTSLNFISSKAGWLMIQPDHGMSSEPGLLYSTSDGGSTWSLTATAVGMEGPYNDKSDTNPLPFGGSISFRNANTGWVTGSFTTTTLSELYRTLDGGRTWQPQTFSLPADLSDGKLDIRTPPEFFSSNSKEGILAARFDPNSGRATDCADVLYTTHDGGASWQAVKTIKGTEIPTDFVNSKEWWCWASIPRDSGSTAPVQGKFETTGDGGKTWKEISPDKTLGGILEKGQDIAEVDFIDSKTGWVLMSAEYNSPNTLLKTTDGGNTWKVVYPK